MDRRRLSPAHKTNGVFFLFEIVIVQQWFALQLIISVVVEIICNLFI